MRTKHLCVLIHIKNKDGVATVKHFKPSSNYITDCSKGVLLFRILLLFVFRVCLCRAILSVPCSLVVTCGEIAELLALLYMMFCVFVGFPCCVLVKVWYLIISIPDLCLLLTFYYTYPSVFHKTDLGFQHALFF